MNKTLVCYHRDMDGWASAFAFWKKYKLDKKFAEAHGEVEYVSVQYGEPVPAVVETGGFTHIYVVDFSFSREISDQLAKQFNFKTIDHHKTAEKELAGAPYLVYDATVSGAELTWKTLHGTNPPLLIQYVGDYDLYKFELPNSREITTYLLQLGSDFETWDNFDFDTALAEGTVLWKQIQNFAKFLHSRAGTAEYLGITTRTIDSPLVYNEAAQRALKAEAIPFAMVYRNDGNKWIVGLRGDKGYDLSAVACVMGGGGHFNAAGFTMTGNFDPVLVGKAVLSAFHAIFVGRMTGRSARQFAEMQLMPLGIYQLSPYVDFDMPEPPAQPEADVETDK